MISVTTIATAVNNEKPLEALALYTLAEGSNQKVDNICKLLKLSNDEKTIPTAKSHTILEDDEFMNLRGVIVLPFQRKDILDIIFAHRKRGWDQKLGKTIDGYYMLTDETGVLKKVYQRKFWWVNDEMKHVNLQSINQDIREIFQQEVTFWLKWQESRSP